MERDVADDHLGVERMASRIRYLDAHAGQRLSQTMHPMLIDVDRREGSLQPCERAG